MNKLKTFKEYMNIRPGHQPATPDTRYDTTLVHDISPETLTLLSIRQDETGPAPADPDDLESLKYFRQQPPKMKQQIVDDLHTLASRVPSDELKQSLTNLASVLGSWPLS